jgi:NADPH2:quinone reductase
LTQLAKKKGARVIGTVSTEEKAKLAREAGADEVILYTQTDFETEVKRLTNGAGVNVVYDSVGRDTFMKSLDCLKPRGYMVLFGQSSGLVPPFDPNILQVKGSIYLTRPTLASYIPDRASLLDRAGDVLNWIASGELKLRIEHTYPLSQAAQAHRDLEGRRTTGKLLLLPD